jgi:Protein of unknown function (DUF3365)
MKIWVSVLGVLALLTGCGITRSLLKMEQHDRELTVRYILATAKAFRTVYAQGIIEQARKAGVAPKEDWNKDDHAIMLPVQFVKSAGYEIRDFELGLIGLTPIYNSNLPKTRAEVDALKRMSSNPEEKVLVFVDGNQFKGMSADFAVVESCTKCHNHHPNSPRRDFKQGDLMGAIVVRLNR